MNNNSTSNFNPFRLTDQLAESSYPVPGWSKKGTRLERKREKVVGWLRKKFKHDQPSLALADKLEGCRPNARCKSAACPECGYAARQLLTTVIKKYLDDQTEAGNTIVCASIVPADGISKPGQLSAAQHQRNVRRWKEALGRAGVTRFIGGSDWSFNEHHDDRYPRHISHHFYGFTATTDADDLKKRLQAQFPKTDTIPRPVKVQEWDGKKKAIRYMAKSEFFRRIGSDDGQRFNKANGKKRSCRATDKQPLRSSQKRELLLHLDQIGLQGRLMLRWVQILHLGTAGSAVVDRGPNGRMRGNAWNHELDDENG
jgi:hypothetical protein